MINVLLASPVLMPAIMCWGLASFVLITFHSATSPRVHVATSLVERAVAENGGGRSLGEWLMGMALLLVLIVGIFYFVFYVWIT